MITNAYTPQIEPDVEFVSTCRVSLYKTNASDLDVARAAWVSQDEQAQAKEAEPGRVEGLINFLMKNKHTSPFEHGQFSFIVRAPMFVRTEFMRHRTWSYNEISGRYTVLPRKFYIAPEKRPLVQKGKIGAYTFEKGTYDQRKLYEGNRKRIYTEIARAYEQEIAKGICNEVAREMLPVSTMTMFWATTNPLNLMRFLTLRTDETALHEIRQVAYAMEDHLENTMPMTYNAWRKHGL